MKNILLAVAGLNPQVITEALYALLHEGRTVDAIHVITTRTGREKILARLLTPAGGVFAEFRQEFCPDIAIQFGPENIHVLQRPDGRELDDIVTDEDNEILLETCLGLTFEFTSQPGTAVFFLVAGGRKTMTSCMSLAAQLYGRPQDRIYHVLVSPEFESCPDFWYPPRESVSITLYDRKHEPVLKETRYAAIHLITIPFVSVRDRLDRGLLDRPRPPADLMQSLVRDAPRLLTVDLAAGKIVYGAVELDMHPARLALYAFFTGLKLRCKLDQPCHNCTACFIEATEALGNDEITELYRHIIGGCRLKEMSDTGIARLSRENFNSYKSKIRQDILGRFGQTHVKELEIAAVGGKPDTRFGLMLDRGRIRMEE